MTENQGKSILVRVSARFELGRVRVIWSQLYAKKVLTLRDAEEDVDKIYIEAKKLLATQVESLHAVSTQHI